MRASHRNSGGTVSKRCVARNGRQVDGARTRNVPSWVQLARATTRAPALRAVAKYLRTGTGSAAISASSNGAARSGAGPPEVSG